MLHTSDTVLKLSEVGSVRRVLRNGPRPAAATVSTLSTAMPQPAAQNAWLGYAC